MKSDIDVLMLTFYDWANTGWRFCKSVKKMHELGYGPKLNVLAYKGQPHAYQYPDQMPIYYPLHSRRPIDNYPIIVNAPELRHLVERAKVVYFLAETFIDTGADLTGKYIIVQTSGSTLRNQPKRVSDFFNPILNKTIAQFPTLMNLGMKNEVLIYYPVDTDFIQPDYERRDPNKIIIGHFPSTPEAKGTNVITSVINKLEADPSVSGKFKYIGERNAQKRNTIPRDWLYQLGLMRECDVIIETIKTEYNGRPFGEFGNTAMEAAALGKIVITNSLNVDLYHKEYGPELAPLITNDAETLECNLRDVLSVNDNDLRVERKRTRKWVRDNHSIDATAKRLWEKVFSEVF